MGDYNLSLTTTKVSLVEKLHPRYAVLRTGNPGGSSCLPGHFAMLRPSKRPPGPFMLSRPFSIMECGKTVDFLIQIVGRGTELLASLEPGDDLDMLLPLGHPFPALDGYANPVLVAGGCGIAPMHFLAAAEARRGMPRRLLYGARGKDELLLEDTLSSVSRLGVSTEDGSKGYRGMVTQLLEVEMNAESFDAVAACGPLPLLERAARLSLERGIDCWVSVETRMGCGFGACLGCAVPKKGGGYVYACKDGPVLNARNIDWERFRGP